MLRVRLSRDIGVAVCVGGLVVCTNALPREASAHEAEETISPRSSLSDALRSFRISKDSSNHTANKSQSGDGHASPVKAVEQAGITNGVKGISTASTSRPAKLAVKNAAAGSSPAEHLVAVASSARHGAPAASVNRHVTVASPSTRNVASPPRVLPHADAGRQIASGVAHKPQSLESRSTESGLAPTTTARADSVVTGLSPAEEQPAVSIASPVVPCQHHYAPLPGPGVDTHQAAAVAAPFSSGGIGGADLSNETGVIAAPAAPVRLLPAPMPISATHMMPVVADNPSPQGSRDDGVHAPFVDVTNGRNGHKHVSVHLPFIHVEHDGEQGHTRVRAPLVNVDKTQGMPASVHAPFTHVAPDATGQGTSVRAPLTSVDKTPGKPAQIKAPFTKVQNAGQPGNVSVHAPLVKVEKKPGQQASVHAPFTKVNTEPKHP